MLILAPDRLLHDLGAACDRRAVLVEDETIRAVAPLADLRDAFPHAAIEALPGCVLMPGMINAHQHGRGISQILMGYADDALEPWIAGRAIHGAPDLYAITRLAAEAMIANGVTACVHANYAYGTGAYTKEIDTVTRAYADSGLRATICVGYQDRGIPYYSREAVDPMRAPYAGDVASTLDLLEELRDRYRGHSTLNFALGPAGPQWVSDEAWRMLSHHASRHGIGLHWHLLESPAQAEACRRLYGGSVLSFLRRLGVFETRTSFAHGVYMDGDDLAVARDEGASLVVNPGANLRLFNGAPPIAAMLDAGCVTAVGTDNCALSDDEDYLRELRLAQILARRPGIEASGPDAGRMLRMATRNGAAAAFMDERVGSMGPGSPADLVALDLEAMGSSIPIASDDLADLVVSRGRGADVRLTMVAGRIVYRASAEDRQRMAQWRQRASRSVADRATAQPGRGDAIRAAVRRHYQERHPEGQL